MSERVTEAREWSPAGFAAMLRRALDPLRSGTGPFIMLDRTTVDSLAYWLELEAARPTVSARGEDEWLSKAIATMRKIAETRCSHGNPTLDRCGPCMAQGFVAQFDAARSHPTPEGKA